MTVAVLGAWWSVFMSINAVYGGWGDPNVFRRLSWVFTGLGVAALVFWPRSARADSMGKALRLVLAFFLGLLWFLLFTIR